MAAARRKTATHSKQRYRSRYSVRVNGRLDSMKLDRNFESGGLDPAAYGTHSLRRTKPTLICRRTQDPRAVQLPLGHTKLDRTVRYLGIEVDDAPEIVEQTEA
jgi:hypothetical protein